MSYNTFYTNNLLAINFDKLTIKIDGLYNYPWNNHQGIITIVQIGWFKEHERIIKEEGSEKVIFKILFLSLNNVDRFLKILNNVEDSNDYGLESLFIFREII